MYSPAIAASTAILLLWISLVTPSLASRGQHHGQNQFRLETYRPSSFWVPSPNRLAQNVLSMQRRPGRPASDGYMKSLRKGGQVDGVYGFEEVDVTERGRSRVCIAAEAKLILTAIVGLVFATEVQIGARTFELVIDTGSSDTWVANTGFQCTRPGTGDFLPQSACEFGPLYDNRNSSFKQIPDVSFRVRYTDGESLSGIFGTEQVTVAGIRVRNQQIALVNTAAWYGDTITSGLLGLAFPAATKAFTGTDSRLDTIATQRIYDPIFTSMYTKGHVAPLFSIALDRDYGGLLAIGGLPPVDYFPLFASSPFQILTTSSSGTQGTSSAAAYTLYTITTNGFDYANNSASQWSYANFPNPFGRPSDPTQIQVIVDTATTTIYLPEGTADAINALFSPPPFFKTNTGFYVVDCKAKPPKFGVKIGFQTFYINPDDMVIELGSRCISGVAAVGPGGTSILGHTFLKNVLAVFDVGAQMMRFAARDVV